MQLKDLPEKLQMDILAVSNKYMRDHPELSIHETKHIDQAVIDGMEFEARRHNSRAEVLWQTLQAFRDAVEREYCPHEDRMTKVLGLVDQCLKENKPEII